MTICGICGAGSFDVRNYPPPPASTELKFESIQICRSCGLGVAHPVPTQEALDRYYESGTFWEAFGTGRASVMHQLVQSLFRVARITPLVSGRSSLRVLDVGSGSATILTALQQRLGAIRLEYCFIEPDEASANALLQRQPGIAKRVSSLSEEGAPYDVIFVNHVLEHVGSAAGFLELILDKLSDEGIAYIEVPNSDYRFKSSVFPHTLFFTPRSLRMLATQVGYEVLDVHAFGKLSSLAPGRLATRIRNKGAHLLFKVAVALGTQGGAAFFDRQIFGYTDAGDGIWLRAILRRQKGTRPK